MGEYASVHSAYVLFELRIMVQAYNDVNWNHIKASQRAGTPTTDNSASNMAHMLGTPTLEQDVLPRHLTHQERTIMKMQEEKWYHTSTAQVFTAEIYYNQPQYNPIYYKKQDFSPDMIPQLRHG